MIIIQKRGLTLLLILILILSSFIGSQTIPAYGADYGRLVIDNVDARTLNQGDSVPVKISIKDNPGLTTICFRVTYDAQILTLNKVENGTLLKGQTNSEKLNTNPYFCGWINSLQKVNCSDDGILVTLYFTIKDKGKAAKTAIGIEKASIEAYSANLDSRDFVISGGTITLADKGEQESGTSPGGTTTPVNPGTDIGSGDTPKPPVTNPSEDEKSEAAEKAALIKTVKNAKISLKSKITTFKKKKAVRLNWKANTKMKFDGYQVYRSVKKNSKYGKKPFYITKKTQYYNTFKLKKGVRYYYKVRAYKVIDGKRYYTSYSNKTWRRVN